MTRPASSVRVAIAGGSGYGGAEMLTWLAEHPVLEAVAVSSRKNAGRPLDSIHPHLTGFHPSLRFVAEPTELLDAEPDAVVLALPHGSAATCAQELLEAAPDLWLVDLSGDHRLDDPAAYAAAYGAEHPFPDELAGGRWVYGVPEASRDALRETTCVANPGCFATGAILAALPLVRAGLVAGPVHHVAITGSSGSGAEAKATTHHPERAEDVKAYKVLAHQHVPEVLRCLGEQGLADGTHWQMVPQSGPFARGIFTTLFVPLAKSLSSDALRTLYDDQYGHEPFVRMRDGTPRVGHVRNTNFCDIAVHADGDTAVVLSAIDNLGKGMASQALQNLNLMFGLPETTGVLRPGARP